MQKLRSVIFATFLALVGLIVGLGRIAKNQRSASDDQVRAIPTVSAPEPTSSAPAVPHDNVADEASAAPTPPQPETRESSTTLPPGAPTDVVFGAILVTFEGAQGAPSKARSKSAALEIAKKIESAALSSFEDAVKLGDPGSMANAGTMRRGILEPSVEYALFTLAKGEVYSEPIETPRGYWIMRRIK